MAETAVAATRVTVDEVKERMDRGEEFTFLDTRNPEAWASSDVKLPGAIRCLPDEIRDMAPSLPRDRTIITYCT